MRTNRTTEKSYIFDVLHTLMVPEETMPSLTCESCGAKLSWSIVRGQTSKESGYATDLFCPACGAPIEQVDVQTLRP